MFGALASQGTQTLAQRSLGDWVLGSLGVTSAVVSAGFAAYMVAVGPAPRRLTPGSADFPVFAAFDRRPRDLAPAIPPVLHPSTAPSPAPVKSATLPPSDVDFTPTGSIGPAPERPASPPALPGSGQDSSQAPHTLAGYAVHDVFDGKAVIEARNKLTIVEPGATIEGVGQVLAIRRQPGGWVVETASGLIRE